MNVFVTSSCPVACAVALDDRRLIKMVLETAQLLSTAVSELGGVGPYRPTHRNHPCSVWARASSGDAAWLLAHFAALEVEYERRFGRVHACWALLDRLSEAEALAPPGPLTPFVNVTPRKDLPIYEAYRATLIEKWRADVRPLKWTNAVPPEWRLT